jgi:hypothetical protein
MTKKTARGRVRKLTVICNTRAVPEWQMEDGEDLVSRLNQEMSEWRWLASAGGWGVHANRCVAKSIQQLMTHAEANPSGERPERIDLQGQAKWIPAGSTVGQYILSVSSSSPLFAAGILVGLFDISIDVSESDVRRGTIAAYLLEQGIEAEWLRELKGLVERSESTAQDALNASASADEQASRMLASVQHQTETLTRTVEKERKNAAETIALHRQSMAEETTEAIREGMTRLEEHIAKGGEQLDQILQESRDRLSQLEAVYEEKLALQAPTAYWRQKRRTHRLYAWLWGSLFVIALGSGIAYLQILLQRFFGWYGAGDPPVWQLSMSAVLVLLLLWLFRVLARLMWSNINQADEAAFKETIAKTFLSLSRAKSTPVNDQERLLMLAELFRHHGDGFVADDGAPPTPGEMLNRLVGRG